MKDNFIKIQKDLLTYSSGKEILVLLFIANNYNYRLNTCSFFLKDLLKFSNYKSCSTNNKIFLEILEVLEKKQIIKILNKPFSYHLFIELEYQQINDKYKKDDIKEYVALYIKEFNTMIDVKDQYFIKSKLETLICIFLFIKSHIYTINEFSYCFLSLNNIAQSLNVSKKTLIRAIEDLKKLSLLHTYQFEQYVSKDNKKITPPTIFSLTQYEKEIIKKDYQSKIKNFKKWSVIQ